MIASSPAVRSLARAALVVWLVLFAVVYVPVTGLGFVRDDFQWFAAYDVTRGVTWHTVVTHGLGFFRPIAAATFAIGCVLFGVDPRGHGAMNLVFAGLVAAGIYATATGIGLRRGAAWCAALVWLMNFHGMTWALEWMVGRTSLLACLGLVWAAAALVRGRLPLAAIGLGCALLSKEEAALGGVALAACAALLSPATNRRTRTVVWTISAVAITAAYLELRRHSDAFTPMTAPSYYTFTHDPHVMLANIREYADRILTPSLLVVVAAWLLMGRAPQPRAAWRVLAAGAVWVGAGIAPTILLPVRSDLYALLPSIGACLAAAALLDHQWSRADLAGHRRVLAAAMIGALALAPVYLHRRERWADLERLSTSSLNALAAFTRALPESAIVVITDDQRTSTNMAAALGDDPSAAFTVWTGRRLRVAIRETPASVLPGIDDCVACNVLRLRLVEGTLRREP